MNTQPGKKYYKPQSVQEAYRLAKSHEQEMSYVSGGTDYWVNSFQGNKSSSCIIDLSFIGDLHNAEKEGDFFRIGSQVKLQELTRNVFVQQNYPALIDAIKTIATPVVRRTATLGGNLLCENRCSFYNQSEFWRNSVGYCLKCDGNLCLASGGNKACFSKLVSDTAPVLLSWNAEIEMYSDEKFTIVPLSSIYSNEGIKPVHLPAHALLTAILIPLKKFSTDFNKLRKRESLDFTSLSTAVTRYDGNKVSIVLVGIDPGPVMVEGHAEDREELIKAAVKKARIVDNDVYGRQYRKTMISVFLNRSFDKIGNGRLSYS